MMLADPMAKTFVATELLQMLDLAPSPEGMVCGMVTRLVPEKGFDALMPVLDRLALRRCAPDYSW